MPFLPWAEKMYVQGKASPFPPEVSLGQVLCDALENDVTIWHRLDENDKARYQYAAEVVRKWRP